VCVFAQGGVFLSVSSKWGLSPIFDFLVTHNGRDFASARFRGLAVVTPAVFLAHLEKELR